MTRRYCSCMVPLLCDNDPCDKCNSYQSVPVMDMDLQEFARLVAEELRKIDRENEENP